MSFLVENAVEFVQTVGGPFLFGSGAGFNGNMGQAEALMRKVGSTG